MKTLTSLPLRNRDATVIMSADEYVRLTGTTNLGTRPAPVPQKDDKSLEVALNGRADLMITGDEDLFGDG